MSWIETIPYQEADGPLKKLYDRVKGPDDKVDNVLSIHSLRPHTLTGHVTLYKSVLHHSANQLPKWYLEALGVYVSHLNHCDYCFDHHFEGFSRLVNDSEKAAAFKGAVLTDSVEHYFKGAFLSGMRYAKRLTLKPKTLKEKHIDVLRVAGFNDGEILEINQVVSYFNYVNRSVVGLGVNTQGDILGLSPNDNDDPTNWNHS